MSALRAEMAYQRVKTTERNLHHMNYIVLDLEWNQCPTGKSGEIRRLPFEIIEIGAVKLDKN